MLNSFFKPEYKIAKILTKKNLIVSTAESCTGGLLSSRLTDVSGSSAYIMENYVTYANEAKIKILNVSPETLQNYGAVSEQCAKEMAEGLFKATGANIAICTTGIAGPTGAAEGKPVGTMFISLKTKDSLIVKKINLNPKFNRTKMKYEFTQKALTLLLDYLVKK